MTYEATERILFAADCVGKFGALDVEEEWANEARSYYIGIVGKYGPQVQAVLKKAAGLDIQTICSLHGPVLKENLVFYLEKYDKWSSYQPEESGVDVYKRQIQYQSSGGIDDANLGIQVDRQGVQLHFNSLQSCFTGVQSAGIGSSDQGLSLIHI